MLKKWIRIYYAQENWKYNNVRLFFCWLASPRDSTYRSYYMEERFNRPWKINILVHNIMYVRFLGRIHLPPNRILTDDLSIKRAINRNLLDESTYSET